MSVSDNYNFVQVDERIATSGQPSAAQLHAARDEGYEVVINLAPEQADNALPGERELLRSLGIEYHNIPVAWTDPRIDQLREFEALMDASIGRRTLVHCAANFRVTVFFALYARAKLGWSGDRCDALIRRIWATEPDYEMDATWKAFIAAARGGRP